MRRIDLIIKYLLLHFNDELTLDFVAERFNVSVPAFCVYFKRYTGMTLIGYLTTLRIDHACFLLEETEMPIWEIVSACGYRSHTNFHKQFLKVKGVTPLQYRNLNAKIRLVYNIR